MAGQISPFDLVTTWTNNLRTLKAICANFKPEVGAFPLNAFALAKVKATVGAASLNNFLIKVNNQFPQFDPNNPMNNPGDTGTFFDLNENVGQWDLDSSVRSCVNLSLGVGAQGPGDNAQLVNLFNQQQWDAFVNGIDQSGLLQVLGRSKADLSALRVPGKTYIDLIRFLQAIQSPNPGGGQ
jgi:hypothetical protein